MTPFSVKIKVECELGAAGQCVWGTRSNYAWVLGVQEGPTWTKQREDKTPLNTHSPECPQPLFLPRFLLDRVKGLPFPTVSTQRFSCTVDHLRMAPWDQQCLLIPSWPSVSWYLLGEGNGSPSQYSCLENPTDGGAW